MTFGLVWWLGGGSWFGGFSEASGRASGTL